MSISRRTALVTLGAGALAVMTRQAWGVEPYGPADADLNVVVMDPMAAPLACDCVKGYAQRKYEQLADFLRERTGKTVRVIWSESLDAALKNHTKTAQLVIGKDSVVRSDAKRCGKSMVPIAQLTDLEGSTQQRGLFVVATENPAATLLDLDEYHIFFGPADCDEKDASPKAKLKELELQFHSAEGDVCESCSIAAKRLMEHRPNEKFAAVISSYAAPLLEGCGAVKKGDLRIVGQSDSVPFISVFADSSVDKATRDLVSDALIRLSDSKAMLLAMETKTGFVPYAGNEIELEKKSTQVR